MLFSLSQISSSKRCQQKRRRLFLELSSHPHVPGFNVVNMWCGWQTCGCPPLMSLPQSLGNYSHCSGGCDVLPASPCRAEALGPPLSEGCCRRPPAERMLRPCLWLRGAALPKAALPPKGSAHTSSGVRRPA